MFIEPEKNNSSILTTSSLKLKVAKATEKEIAASNSKKAIAFKNKWYITNDIV